MSYIKKLIFMLALKNRSVGAKFSWIFSWMFIPALFNEEYNTEKSFQDDLKRRWI